MSRRARPRTWGKVFFYEPLTLEYLTPVEIAPRLQTRQQALPPAVAGFHRGFGAFFLEATDDQGRDVGTFRAPLTIQVRFPPQQLRVLGIAPENLTLFWFDESREPQRGGPPQRGQWVPQRTVVDLATGTATIQVDHFSGYQLSDGSSPSAAFIPSLQGWQVSGFTGAASFSYPLDLPAGPAGIKPALALSYSSAATDGGTNMRTQQQASWVGKGWTLDTGSVSLNKIEVSSTNIVNQYAMSVGGRSYNLVRAEALIGGAEPCRP